MAQFTDDNLMQYPLVTQSKFHSQFMLDPLIYKDQNNYLIINNVEVSDNRFAIFDNSEEFKFVDHISNQMWLGKSAVWAINSTRDDGLTFRIENQLNMQAYYFFMSNQRVKHSRSVYTLIKVMSDFGGMIQIFTLLFTWSCTAFNDRQFLAKMIRALYFKDNSKPG